MAQLTGIKLLEQRKREEAEKANAQKFMQTGTSSTSQGRKFMLPTTEAKPLTSTARPGEAQIALKKSASAFNLPQREEPTIATADTPLKTVTPGTSDEFGGLTDREKQVQVLLKQSKGQSLSDEERQFMINRFIDQQEVTTEDIAPGIADKFSGVISDAELEAGQRKQSLKTEREDLIEEKERLLSVQKGVESGRVTEAGKRVQEASGTALSFSGFGRSTFAADQAAQIQKDTNQQIEAINRAADLELDLFRKAQEGADEATLAGLQDNINQLKAQAQQFEIDSAIKVAELNQQNSLNFEESFSNLLQTLNPDTQTEVDEFTTKSLGVLADKHGNPILRDGQMVEVGSSEFTFTAPKFDAFGNQLSPGYMFNKDTSELQVVNPDTGAGETVATGGLDAANASQAFSNFDAYAKGTGSGAIVAGAPYHKGLEVDIDGKIGDPVTAYTGGKVISITDTGDKDFGKSVVIETPDGVQIRYAHLDGFNVKKGQEVPAGALLGGMGNTGAVIPLEGGDGSHLHIEARKGGQLVALQDINSEVAGITTTDINSLRAEAFENGYVTNSEVLGYINARKQGIQPPDKAQTDMDDLEFARGDKLRDEFNALTSVKDFKEVKDKVQDVKGIIESGFKGPGDLAIVFQFMKALDPTSVVRESEYKAAATAGNIFLGQMAKFNGYLDASGGFLPPNVKQDFLAIVQNSLRSKQDSFNKEMDRYRTLSAKSGVDSDFVVFDYTQGIEDILSGANIKLEVLAEEQEFDIEGARAAGATEDEIRLFLTQ